MRKQPRAYFVKLLFFGIIISSVPVILIGIFSYFKASSAVQNHANASKEQHLYQIQNNIEQVLKTTDHSLNNFVNSTLASRVLNEPMNVYQFQLYNQVRQELTHLQTFDTGIADIVLLSTDQRWFMNNVGLYRAEQVDDWDKYFGYYAYPVNSYWMLETDLEAEPGFYSRCESQIQLVKKLPLNSSRKKGIAITKIPTCYLNEMFSYDDQNESIMVIDQNNHVLLHADSDSINDEAAAPTALATILEQEKLSGQFRLPDELSDITITYRKSAYNGWTYMSFTSIKALTKESRAIGWFTLAISLALLLLGMIAAWFGSRRMYGPIEKLFQQAFRVFQAKPDRLSKDGFEFLTEQIHRIVSTNSQLENRLQSQIGQLRILFMLKLFQGELHGKEISDKLHALALPTSWEQLAVMTIQMDTLENTRYSEDNIDLLLFAINNIMEELVEEQNRLSPILIDQSQTTVLLGRDISGQSFQNELAQLAKTAQQTIKHYLQISVSIGISLTYCEMNKTNEAYQESVEALKNRIRLGDNAIIFYGDLPQGGFPVHAFYASKLHNELSDAIKLAERDKVDRLLADFFQELSRKQLSPSQYELWIARLLIDLVQLPHSIGIPYVSFSDNQSVFEQMFKWRSGQEVQAWLRHSVIEPIIVAIEDRTRSQYKKISEQIITLIQEEFDQDLSLESIAARLHYNANYISSVFRKETGIAFSEYLSMHRHQKAIHYLLETPMTVRDISEKLQYNNAQNFIRSFRKIEGVTPGQYRENYQGA